MAANALHVRRATMADEAAISTIRLSVTENILSDPSKVTRADYAAYMGPVGQGWVAERAGAMVGFAMANRSGLIWALFIKPGHDGQGIGKALLACCLDWLREIGVHRAFLDTGPDTRAEGFYRHLGWQEIARTPLRVDMALDL